MSLTRPAGSVAVLIAIALGACTPPPATPATPAAGEAAAPTAAAACVLTPAAEGSADRTAILDALRPKIEEMTGKPVEFVVNRLESACDYARLIAQPKAKTGGDQYEPVDALFVRRDGLWELSMIASGEEGSDPAADQYKAKHADAPEALLYL